jgi:hypothetical protein
LMDFCGARNALTCNILGKEEERKKRPDKKMSGLSTMICSASGLNRWDDTHRSYGFLMKSSHIPLSSIFTDSKVKPLFSQ